MAHFSCVIIKTLLCWLSQGFYVRLYNLCVNIACTYFLTVQESETTICEKISSSLYVFVLSYPAK